MRICPLIYISGGKTGSNIINNVVSEALEDLLKICNLVHQCGDHSIYHPYETLLKKYSGIKDLLPGNYTVRKFVLIDEIGEVFTKTSLVVSRSGAHSVMELLALEKPCILIPIPWVSHNEQFENALILQKAGLAEILEEKDLNPETLVRIVTNSLKHINDTTRKIDLQRFYPIKPQS
jgi:UDP-N-acetylglucosamine--N-acetylmuramyl-(pentapeptide) pyrophosphoryl-undecaprenol N-acetylglucosamine transferase